MKSQADKEKEFTSLIEKGVMYFLYFLFGGLFFYITFAKGWKEAWILLPIAALTIPTTK